MAHKFLLHCLLTLGLTAFTPTLSSAVHPVDNFQPRKGFRMGYIKHQAFECHSVLSQTLTAQQDKKVIEEDISQSVESALRTLFSNPNIDHEALDSIFIEIRYDQPEAITIDIDAHGLPHTPHYHLKKLLDRVS